jgi:hypothetical protein
MRVNHKRQCSNAKKIWKSKFSDFAQFSMPELFEISLGFAVSSIARRATEERLGFGIFPYRRPRLI